MPSLVLMRHGATVFSEQNRFAGWADTELNRAGQNEAENGARALIKAGLAFDYCFTSRLKRAEQTLAAVTKTLRADMFPIIRDWRLNERHYGALQGESRVAMVARYGNSQVTVWRRSYHARPPELTDDDPRWLEQLERLPDVPPEHQPRGESLADAVRRVTPVWDERIAPALKGEARVLVVAHTSAIRALVCAIEGLDEAGAEAFRIATAVPCLYALDNDLQPLERKDIVADLHARYRFWTNRLKPQWLAWI